MNTNKSAAQKTWTVGIGAVAALVAIAMPTLVQTAISVSPLVA
jgi:hypothetical protein